MTSLELGTKNGTLRYEVEENGGIFKGKITHDLHKHPKLKGKKLTTYSKEYKTKRGALNWVKKSYDNQLNASNK